MPEVKCDFCGEVGADKKKFGQNFHKACLRKARRQSKKLKHPSVQEYLKHNKQEQGEK